MKLPMAKKAPRIASRVGAVLAYSIVFLLHSLPGEAGTLCGSVRDASTSSPVSRAGIFLRTPAGSYTGLYGATDATGSFCVLGVPPGTYDLEIRVDHYETAYVRNVEVVEDVIGVDVALEPPVSVLAPPWPNPGRFHVTFRFLMQEPGAIRLVVYDITGRAVHGWDSPWHQAGTFEINWNFTGADRRPVPSGSYFIRLDTGGRSAVRAFIRAR